MQVQMVLVIIFPSTSTQKPQIEQDVFEQKTTPPDGHSKGGEYTVPNLNMEIVDAMAKQLGLTFVPEKEADGNVCLANSSEVRNEFKETFAPIDLLDYIYAVLHSPTYEKNTKSF